MDNKLKNMIKENLWWIIILSIIFGIYYLGISSLSTPEIKQSLSRSLSQLKFEDLIILVIIHAWINRSDKCNCKH